jgi:hypothetical protein
MRRISLTIAAVLLAVAGIWWWHSQAEIAPWRPALSAREVATRVLGEHLAKKYPGAKVLVFGNPFTQRPGQSAEIYAFEKSSVHGLELGFGTGDSFRVVYPRLRADSAQRSDAVFVDPKTTTPLSYLVAEDAFDRLIQTNAPVDLLVSLIGVPANVRQSKLWQDPEKPRLALLLPDWQLIGPHDVVRAAIKSEKIAAAVIRRPGVNSEEELLGQDYRADFNRYFFMVTKENIDELLRSYPQAF